MPNLESKPSFSPSPRFTAAFEYACQLHADQARKGTTIPYIAHLMAVAALVIEHGGGEDEAIAALLHDAIEDQNHDGSVPGEIGARFGPKVLVLVEACSDSEGPDDRPLWRKRKEAYLAHLRGAPANVRLISAADKLPMPGRFLPTTTAWATICGSAAVSVRRCIRPPLYPSAAVSVRRRICPPPYPPAALSGSRLIRPPRLSPFVG